MKLSSIVSVPLASRIEPIFRFNWLPANLISLIAAGIILTTGVVVMQRLQETQMPETKSVAWYMANPQDALAQNKECYDKPELKTTANCLYSLEALEITHKGPNS